MMLEEEVEESDEEEPGRTSLTSNRPLNLEEMTNDRVVLPQPGYFKVEYKRLTGLSKKEQRLLDIIVEPKYYWENGWVLMNLSKKEYVTSKAASNILRYINPKNASCLGELILSKICWSSDLSTGLEFHRALHRGVWAGDRFRIVTTDVFETRTSGEEGWEDVSVEATTWLKGILQSNERTPLALYTN
jgi:hypothetical protein